MEISPRDIMKNPLLIKDSEQTFQQCTAAICNDHSMLMHIENLTDEILDFALNLDVMNYKYVNDYDIDIVIVKVLDKEPNMINEISEHLAVNFIKSNREKSYIIEHAKDDLKLVLKKSIDNCFVDKAGVSNLETVKKYMSQDKMNKIDLKTFKKLNQIEQIILMTENCYLDKSSVNSYEYKLTNYFDFIISEFDLINEVIMDNLENQPKGVILLGNLNYHDIFNVININPETAYFINVRSQLKDSHLDFLKHRDPFVLFEVMCEKSRDGYINEVNRYKEASLLSLINNLGVEKTIDKCKEKRLMNDINTSLIKLLVKGKVNIENINGASLTRLDTKAIQWLANEVKNKEFTLDDVYKAVAPREYYIIQSKIVRLYPEIIDLDNYFSNSDYWFAFKKGNTIIGGTGLLLGIYRDVKNKISDCWNRFP